MDYRSIVVSNIDGKGNNSKHQSYIFLDKIPVELYKDFYEKALSSNVTLDNFTVSISDKDGWNVLNLSKNKALSEGYYAYVELEFRGMLESVDGKGKVTLSDDYILVAHYWFQDKAVCIALGDIDIGVSIKDVKNNLKKRKIKTNIVKGKSNLETEYFPEVTKYFTKKDETDEFIKEMEDDYHTRNIVTGKVKIADVENDLCNRDLF